MWKTCGQLAAQYGVTRITVGNWIREGKLTNVKRTEGGHYRIWCDNPCEVVGYCRVSSAKQRSSIDGQRRVILASYPNANIVFDIGSGFNFKRRQFRAILERVVRGASIELVVATGDRITRTGLPFIRWVIELHGGKVTELEKSDSEEGFDSAQLVGFITCFIASYHGKRSKKRMGDKKTASLPCKR